MKGVKFIFIIYYMYFFLFCVCVPYNDKLKLRFFRTASIYHVKRKTLQLGIYEKYKYNVDMYRKSI